ncbi:NmrA family NAD(P)-binding protein [Sphingomonas sp. LB3N6]|uniref:NmrA family NAD(P)-binding protein n=1 Tax=Sphingomonas fucosidasi TaxID=3096164 RepID=UPI002FC7F949
MTDATAPIVLAGATGDLGGRIAHALAARGATVRALVRTGARHDTLPPGVTVVAVDFADPPRLAAACAGAACVVSAVNGLAEVVLGLQTRLLDAAVASGVPRFIPSDYSLDFTRTTPGRNRNLDLRRAFMARIDAAPIRATSILNGAFADLLAGQAPIVLPRIRRILHWGSAEQAYDFTIKDDVAVFTAAAAMDDASPRLLRIAGDSVSPRDLTAIMTGVTGQRFGLLRAGGVSALSALIGLSRVVAPQREALFPAWQGMQYLRDMASGQGKLLPLDNCRYPDVAFTSAQTVLSSAYTRA